MQSSTMISSLKVLLLVANFCIGQIGCDIEGFMDLSYLSTKLSAKTSPENHDAMAQALPEQLRIVDSMRFSCSGEITGFYLGAAVKTEQESAGTYPRAIIFRRRAGDDRRRRRSEDGIYYTRRGSVELRPTFTELQTASGGIYKYLIPSSDTLSFSSGDVFGVYQPPPLSSRVILYYTNSSQSFETTSYVRTAIDTSNRISQFNLQQIRNEYLLIYPIVDANAGSSSCLPQFLNEEILRVLSPLIGNLQFPTVSELRLFPDINFQNDTYITSWTVGGISNTNSISSSKTEFQIWTKSDENTLMVSAVYQLNMPIETNQNNLFEFQVNPPIQVKAGDILGVFQPPNSMFQVYYQEHNGPRNVIIGLQESPQLPSLLELAVVSAASGVNDYPLITVNVTNEVLHMTKSSFSSFSPTITTKVVKTSSQVSSTQSIARTQQTSLISTVSSLTRMTSSSSQQQPSLAAAASNDPALIAIISIGTAIIALTIPALIITILVAVYLHRKSLSSNSKDKTGEVYDSTPSNTLCSDNVTVVSSYISSASLSSAETMSFPDSTSSTLNSVNVTTAANMPSINSNTLSSSYNAPPSSLNTNDKSAPVINGDESRDSMEMNPLYYYNVRPTVRKPALPPCPPPNDQKYVNITSEPIYEEI